MSWRSEAACKDLPKELFFPDNCGPNESQFQKAIKVCKTCPVQEPCLADAMKHERGERCRYGVFGGLTPKQRYLLDKTGERVVQPVAPPITTRKWENLPAWLRKKIRDEQ